MVGFLHFWRWPCFGKQAFHSNPGCLLLRLLLCRCLRLTQGSGSTLSIGNTDLDAEELLVIGTALRGQHILRLSSYGGLQVLL